MSLASHAYSHSFKSIDGTELPLSSFKGKVLLVVNTASRCGFTPQYEGLQKLYETYKDKGLVVLGVPSNDFGAQEPEDEASIKKFTESQFKVSFPLTAKEKVTGSDAHPFYLWAAKQDKAGLLTGTPRWNFHKFLVGRQGQLLGAYSSVADPMGESLKKDIEAALSAQ